METKNTVVDAETPLESSPAAQEQKSIDLNETVSAYVVALNKDGNFVFQTFGSSQGVLEVTGLHAYAGRKIGDLVDRREGRNTAAVIELGRIVVDLNQKVTHLLNKIDPPKPDNAL